MAFKYKAIGPYAQPFDNQQCAASVYSSIPAGFSQCQRKSQRDGWCWQHHPDHEKEQQEEAAKREQAKLKRIRAPRIRLEKAEAENAALLAEVERLRADAEKRFPVCARPGVTIPWSVAEQVYLAYADLYGTSQSIQRIAERGGFHVSELDKLYPQWRELIRLMEVYARLCSLVGELVTACEKFSKAQDFSAHVENLQRQKDLLKQENADLRQQLAASQQEAAAGQARERELRDGLTRLERGFIALDDETDWLQCRWCEGENVGANPNHIGDCPFVPLAEKPQTAALDAALAEAEQRGRDNERQLTREVIILARQRLRREGAEAQLDTLEPYLSHGVLCKGSISGSVPCDCGLDDAIRTLPLDTGEGGE